MKLLHVGTVARSAQAAERFYGELLGLKRASTKSLAPALAQQLFGVERELSILNFVGDGAHFEVFVDEFATPSGRIAHVCLEVEDLDRLIERARSMNFPILRVAKGSSWVTFLDDDNGHRFELKSAPD
jgi:catechol 2,3-dioxygenase-like lactoylglutathione lyase family enzyme